MKLLLEEDKSVTHIFQYIWGKEESGWSCLWCRNAVDGRWDCYNISLESLKSQQAPSGVKGDSPVEAYPKSKFKEITEADLFVLLL